jgi:hypothetical protein
MRGSNAPSRRDAEPQRRACAVLGGEEMVAKLRHLRRIRAAQRMQAQRRKLTCTMCREGGQGRGTLEDRRKGGVGWGSHNSIAPQLRSILDTPISVYFRARREGP